MARIDRYGDDSTLNGRDRFLGTDGGTLGSDGGVIAGSFGSTKNFLAEDVRRFMRGFEVGMLAGSAEAVVGTVNYIPPGVTGAAISLPTLPEPGSTIYISNRSGLTTNTITSTHAIDGSTADISLPATSVTRLVFFSSRVGWLSI